MFAATARVLLAVVVVAATPACSAAHDPDERSDTGAADVGRDALSPVDANDVDANGGDAAGVLTLSADRPMLEACNCHHGCAPGIDGTFALEVSSTDCTSHLMLVTEVSLRPVGSPGGPFVAPGMGWFRVMGAAADGTVTIEAGATPSLRVMVYLDLPMLFPGTYEIRIRVLVDGAETTVGLPAAFVPMGMGCP